MEFFKKYRLINRTALSSWSLWFDALLLVAVAVTAYFVLVIWGWKCTWTWLQGDDSNGETIRNVGLIIGAIIAMRLAIWRSRVAERQVQQVQRQVDTARRGLLNERYQKGAEMLGDEKLSVRLGGVYALERVAAEAPEEFHLQIMQQFCAFVRNPTEDPSYLSEEPAKVESRIWQDWEFDLRPDVQAIMKSIADRSYEGVALEIAVEFMSDLRGSNLRGLQLDGAVLSHLYIWKADLSKSSYNLTRLQNVDFSDATLSPVAFVRTEFGNTRWDSCQMHGALFNNSVFLESSAFEGFVACDLTGADFSDADLSGVGFGQSNLQEARFDGTNLTRVKFSANGLNPAYNLTQSQLDVAVAEPHNPPVLTGLVDVDTGEPLVWRGSAI